MISKLDLSRARLEGIALLGKGAELALGRGTQPAMGTQSTPSDPDATPAPMAPPA